MSQTPQTPRSSQAQASQTSRTLSSPGAAPSLRHGVIHGVGLGPGDPDRMSVRADRLVRGARHVAYFRKAGRKGRART
ncbi:MAG: hypothetical protein AAF763_17435, partial [Pseudomonadota bacterium]